MQREDLFLPDIKWCKLMGWWGLWERNKKKRQRQIMFERIYPKAISWLSIAAFIPSSGLPGNSVSKSVHWQPRSIITTNPIHVSLECAGLFLRGKLGPFVQLLSFNRIYSFRVSLLKWKSAEHADVCENAVKRKEGDGEDKYISMIHRTEKGWPDGDGQIRASSAYS